jgi:hypothetical protein
MQEILPLVLADDRDPQERIASLRALSDYLQDEDVVFTLAEAARTEKTVSVRAAILELVLSIDLTQLDRRAEYIEMVADFSALEREPALRAAAVRRLATLAPSDADARAVLAENLVQDLNEEVQRYSLDGLAGCPRKEPSVVERLVAYARQAPPALREELLRVYAQLERADFEAGLLALLNPLETRALRGRILTLIGNLPSLNRTMVESLLAYLREEPLPELREQTVRILGDGVQANPELFDAVLDAVRVSPEDAALLYAFWNRLCADPETIPKLQALFRVSGSDQVKLYLLRLLHDADAVPLFTAALADPSPWVRRTAVGWCMQRARRFSGPISQALAARIPAEHLTHLRAEMIGVLGAMGRLDPAIERFIVQRLPEEASPAARQILAGILPEVAVTDQNRRDILRAYVHVLREPFFEEALKAKVTEQLHAFAYRDDPDLIECLKALMERATDLIEVERLYAQLRTLERDFLPLVPLVRKLFYRFIGRYPQDPLTEWLRDLANVASRSAEVRAEIPYLVRLTGAGWILDKADPDDQKATVLPSILEAVRRNRHLDAQRLLDEAYKQHTLRKSDAVSLYRQLLTYHDSYPFLDSVLRVFQDAKIVTADLVEWSLRWLCRFPGATAAYNVQQYLEAMGPLEPSYSRLLDQAFTADMYRRYRLVGPGADRRDTAPRKWDEYWSSPPGLRDWPIAVLYFAQASSDAVAEKLDTAPVGRGGEGIPDSFAYLILAQINQQQTLDEILLAAVGRLIRASRSLPGAELLYERAQCVFDTHWPAFSQASKGKTLDPEVSRMAAEVFVELCVRRYGLGPEATERDPAPLTGMDLDHCRTVWPLGDSAWEALWDRYAGYLAKPTSTLFARPRPGTPERTKQPLGFKPLAPQAHDALLDFLFRTPLGSDPLWRDRWKTMLQAAQWHNSFAYLLTKLTETERQRIVGLLA